MAKIIAEGATKSLDQMPIDHEVLIAEIGGFAGVSTLRNPYSSNEMGSSRISNLLPDHLVQELRLRDLNPEIVFSQNLTPRNPNTTLVVRQFIDHDPNSYGPDKNGNYTYMKSVFKIYMRKVSPTLPESQPALAVTEEELHTSALVQLYRRLLKRLSR